MKFIRRFKENSLQKSIGLELETFKEMELGAGKDEQHCRGFYLHYNGKRIGIVATNEGPVFLCNEDKYLLDQHAVHFILKNIGSSTLLYLCGKVT